VIRKELNQKEQIGIVIAIIASVTVGIVFLMWMVKSDQEFDEALSGTSDYQKPSLTEIKEMCRNKMIEQGYSEPTEMMINICAGTVVNGLAETRP
jgi:nitrogen fixation-related uncharacterized protein